MNQTAFKGRTARHRGQSSAVRSPGVGAGRSSLAPPLQPVEARFLFLAGPPLELQAVSDGVRALLGYEAGDFMAGRVALETLVHAGDADLASRMFAGLSAAQQEILNLRLRRADGTVVCVRCIVDRIVQGASRSRRVEMLVQDARSLARAPADQVTSLNFRALMENTDDFIFFKDRNHVYTGASRTMVGVADKVEHWSDLIGKTDYDLFDEAHADLYYELEKQVYNGQPVARGVQEYRTEHGGKGWVDNHKYPIHDERGKIIGLFGVARDITESKRMTAKLEHQEQFSRSLIDNLPGIFYLYTWPENRLVLWNKQHETLLGYRAEEMLGRHVLDWHQPTAHGAVLEAIDGVMRGDYGVIEVPMLAKDGRLIYFSLNGTRFDTPEQTFLMGIGTDITERRKVEEALRLSEERHRLIADNAADVIWTTDLEGHLTYVSPSIVALRGYSVQEALQQTLDQSFMPESAELVRQGLGGLVEAVKAGRPTPSYRGEFELRCKDGSSVWTEITATVMLDAEGKFVAILGVTRDISHRRRMEAQIRQLAFHDTLTGLPNRRLLHDRLSQALASSKRSGLYGALMFVDLDNFKPLNDTYGHEIGDLLLIDVARRLNCCVRQMDTVARFGGDEFIVMVGEIDADRAVSVTTASLIAEKIRNALAEPYHLAARQAGAGKTLQYNCTASIGLAVFLGAEANEDEIIKAADAAMYQAKVRGNDAVQVANPTCASAQKGVMLASTFVQLAWHPAYECGQSVIDDQHRNLFYDANRILTAMLGDATATELTEMIDLLVSDVIRHFKEEENIINDAGFVGAVEHAAIHSRLIDRALTLVGQFRAGKLGVGELFQFLAYELIAQHLLAADRAFFPLLQSRRADA